MAKIERTKNTITGAFWGVMDKISSILLPFLVRTFLIKNLGADYLGLSGLFTSILQVLNLTELGFGAAAVYAMYKPISEDDYSTVGAIIYYLKKIYRIIGVAIMLIGVATVPFLDKITHGDIPSDINIYILFGIYLVNTSISYLLFAYKTSLLQALQLSRITSRVSFFANTIMRLAQIAILILIPNYYAYVILLPICTLTINLVNSQIVDKNYKCWLIKSELNMEIRDDIRKRLFPLMSTKLASVLVNSAGTLVISAFLGLTQVAIYNNYYYIMNSVSGFLIVIYGAMQAGIGNVLVVDSHKKIMSDFKKFHFINNWIVTVCTVCLLCLYQPFMQLWVGEELMLSFAMVVLFCIYFYANTIQRIVVIYKDAAGIWKEDMVRCYLSCILNLVVNIITVRYIGLYGVIGSSVVANLIGLPWMAFILYHTIFKESSKGFYKTEIGDALVAIIICFFSYLVVMKIPYGVVGLLLKGIICVLLSNLMLWMVFRKNEQYLESRSWLLNMIRKRG